MLVSLIAAMAKNRVIGHHGKVPWRLPEDLAHFKEKTLGHPVIIGRKTWETLDGPLEGREMTVLSRNPDYRAPGCKVAHGVEEALSPYRGTPLEVFVAGGQEVYEATLALADRIYLTLVEGDFEGDAFFPHFGEEDFSAAEVRTPAPGRCRFVAYERRRRK
ncbi:MAG: dihydrofolate reductase [Acidobacteria bacterium]|nr:dihydrofolate reductase [Acidobacteriota bacterium]